MTITPSASPLDLEKKRGLIEETLSKILPEKTGDELFAAARYSLFGAAKRIRPLLCLIAHELFGGDIEQALYPACALEMLHTYSLIHDDLPCMDDDDLRRGRPTLHKVYPEGHAVLTGDFLLTYAFEVLATSPGLTAEQKLDLVRALSYAAGEKGMIGGQVLDLDWSSTDYHPRLHELVDLHEKKTAALFSAALEMGAIAAGASYKDRQLLMAAGRQIGLAFQIADDLADKDGITLLLDPEEAKSQIHKLLISIEEQLGGLSCSSEPLLLYCRAILRFS